MRSGMQVEVERRHVQAVVIAPAEIDPIDAGRPGAPVGGADDDVGQTLVATEQHGRSPPGTGSPNVRLRDVPGSPARSDRAADERKGPFDAGT